MISTVKAMLNLIDIEVGDLLLLQITIWIYSCRVLY